MVRGAAIANADNTAKISTMKPFFSAFFSWSCLVCMQKSLSQKCLLIIPMIFFRFFRLFLDSIA